MARVSYVKEQFPCVLLEFAHGNIPFLFALIAIQPVKVMVLQKWQI